ncbi:MAG: creatininase family protein, partial [Vicinamibacteria bacterium]
MRRIALAVAFAALAAAAASAHAAPSVFVDDLTWTELRDRIASGATTVIVPVGGSEQNGPHMALGKHNARARALAERVALALGDTLVAPVVAYVPEGNLAPPTAHMRFPGTVTVPTAAFEATLESIAQSYKLAGFRDIAFVGDHGGYQSSLQAVAQRLNRAWAKSPVRAHAIVEYYRAAE